MLRIHQAIWGYSNGHRLLASSMPLSSQSIKILEPLSDLSGTEMFNKFWPSFLTKIIMIFYKKAYDTYN